MVVTRESTSRNSSAANLRIRNLGHSAVKQPPMAPHMHSAPQIDIIPILVHSNPLANIQTQRLGYNGAVLA